jgi:uncharacterized caspase-like protein
MVLTPCRLTKTLYRAWPIRAAGVVIIGLFLLLPPHISAGERLALLIGHEKYNDSVGLLKNPHNDINIIGAALARVGFAVSSVSDASHKDLHTNIKAHIARVQAAGGDTVSFIYYSGHGAADETGINYLIPVDVTTSDTTSVWNGSVELKADLVDKLAAQAPRATHYVVFDACRTELKLKSPGKPFEVGGQGFVPVIQSSGILIAYATAPNKTASDAGVYARILAEELAKPNAESVSMFRNVQLRVNRTIGQSPWLGNPWDRGSRS